MACLLVLPTALEGFSRDDFYHRALLKGETVFPGEKANPPLSAAEAARSLFAFFGPDNDNFAHGREAGLLPWWADERLELRFWRPVAALSHWLDYQLWPDSPWAMHLQSILWYTALVWVWGTCLRQFGYRGWGLLAGLVAYGIDASHIGAVGWLANRNILIAATLGFLSLLYLHQSVQTQRLDRLAWSVLLFAASLLSAEGSIATAAFIGSYALFMDPRPWRMRLQWMLPFAITLAGWRSLYSHLGFAVRHSGAYMDPVSQPWEYFTNLCLQAPILVLDQLTGNESFQLSMSPTTVIHQALIGTVVGCLVLATAWPLLRSSNVARFMYVGAVLAILPAGSTLFTGGRLLFFSGAGMCALLGLFLKGLLANAAWLPASRLYRGWAWTVLILMTICNLFANGYIWQMVTVDMLDDKHKPAFGALSDLATLYNGEAQNLIAVNPPLAFDLMYAPLKGRYQGIRTPPAITMLAPGVASFVLTRVADNAVEIHSEGDSLAISAKAEFAPVKPLQSLYYSTRRSDAFFAGTDFHMKAGTLIQLRDANVTVKEVNAAGVPRRVLFEFATNLSAARYQWLFWDFHQERYSSFTLPEMGDSIRIAGPFEP